MTKVELQENWRGKCLLNELFEGKFGEVDMVVTIAGEFRVLRYFPLGDEWQVSCDYKGNDMGEMLKAQAKAISLVA
jgi:hypothetical protein